MMLGSLELKEKKKPHGLSLKLHQTQDHHGDDCYEIVIHKHMHNKLMATYPVKPEFFDSNDYQKIANVSKESAHLFTDESYIMIDNHKKSIDNLQSLIEILDETMRKKVTIQRYKGLGK